MSAIDRHNTPLREQMKRKGCTLVHRDGKASFYRDGVYVPYPPGYVTGPSSCSEGFYLSVQGPNGWHQRTWRAGQYAKAEQWALETARKILAELPPEPEPGPEDVRT